MANPNGNPQNLRPRQKGDPPLNPSGRPKGSFSKDEIRAKITNLMAEPVDALEKKLTGGKCSALEAMICAVIVTAVKSGDFTRLNGLLDRTLGKVKDEIEQTIRNVTDEDLESIPQDALLKLISNA